MIEMKSADQIKGYVCSKCGGNIKGEDIKIISHIEYEGLDIGEFICPHCNKKTDDLQCDFWVVEEENI